MDKELVERLYSLNSEMDFSDLALDVFKYQYETIPVYQAFCKALQRYPDSISLMEEIPFLPIEFFKSHKVYNQQKSVEEIFTSSGTTGSITSKHFVHSLKLYEYVFLSAFEAIYGNLEEYVVLALLPAYLEREGSSLVYMVNSFIEKSGHGKSGFYLNDYNSLATNLKELDSQGNKILLIGVSFALLDLVEQEQFQLNNTIIMETGGMKGRRREITREELHNRLKKGFGVAEIHSEYGMTELLSQAYATEGGVFRSAPSMKVLIREAEDPLTLLPPYKNGGLNIIDLANIYSCAFIATQDLGKIHSDGRFEVLGRFDHSDIRGCNLMVI